ncbi:MAG: HTH domain-containing protein [Candidatus Pacearchaeota archaeon]
MEEFNLWDLDRINIRVNKSFLDKINQEISLQYKNKVEAYRILFLNKEIPWISFKNMLKKSYMRDFFVPLEILLKITDKLRISKEELQKNVIAYKTAGGVNYIENPILPIKITPVFHMLLGHHLGDGTAINPRKGRLPYFGYRQFNEFYRVGYIRKIESIFGKINFKKDYITKSTRPYCPPSISTLLFNYYNFSIKDFNSLTSRLPQDIFQKDKDSLLAILCAFIIDEGHVDSTLIVIALKNKPLVLDLKKICDILDYDSKITYRFGEYRDYGYLQILRKGMKRLYLDYLNLNKKYSVIDLGWKGKQIEDSFKVYTRKIQRAKGNKNLILNILKNEQLSVNQLANQLNMTRQGIRFHIHNLLKENEIRIINKNDPNWLYGV